ncbi:MAG: hypothetical protein LR015_00760 [Verrucomicrobia bacterium]|nr:hypothetical protein [Verrucomicrobiota bacterium]
MLNLQFVVGYAYIESEVALGVAQSYKDAVGVPTHNATFWGKYTFIDGPLDGFAIGLGLNYTGSRRLFAPLRQFLEQGNEKRKYIRGWVSPHLLAAVIFHRDHGCTVHLGTQRTQPYQ